jgi:hypothetical protein
MDEVEFNRLTRACSRRHLRFGWWALLGFLTLGIVLEALHAVKLDWYLSVENETRRLMFTLAHAHGTLVSLVNIAFGATLALLPLPSARSLTIASRCLLGANVLLPAGFFLGGGFSVAGDPGLGIVLLPIGAILLLVGVFVVARGATSNATSSHALADSAQSPRNSDVQNK